MRQFHLWVGAWGALAAVRYGFTGLVMSHRFAFKLRQGESVEVAQALLRVPVPARATPETLMAWLEQTHGFGSAIFRGGPRPVAGAATRAPARWMIGGGDARSSWNLE